jgi:hypothetical protein
MRMRLQSSTAVVHPTIFQLPDRRHGSADELD